MATKHDWEGRQRRLNAFYAAHLKGYPPLRVDGVPGELTRRYIIHAQWFLGWQNRTNKWSDKLDWHLRYAQSKGKGPFEVSLATLVRGKKRRLAHNQWWERQNNKPRDGTTLFDGKQVARGAIPSLIWARGHGWKGVVVSGYRTPAYSEHLCYVMCGHPTCPGRCAGRGTNHAWATMHPPRWAVDVSDYVTFGRLMVEYNRTHPNAVQIHNFLPNDRVHFSPSGR